MARALLVRFRILLLNVVAVAGAVAALLPLVPRRRPLGSGASVRTRAARAVEEERRRAAPS